MSDTPTRTRQKSYWIRMSNFSTAGSLPNAVAICRGIPQTWGERPIYQALAPTWAMLKMSMADYIPLFDEILGRTTPQKVIEDMNGKIMLCWCRSNTNCHRRMVATWIAKHTGIGVMEYEPGEAIPGEAPRARQEELPLQNTGRRRLLPMGQTAPEPSGIVHHGGGGHGHEWQSSAIPR